MAMLFRFLALRSYLQKRCSDIFYGLTLAQREEICSSVSGKCAEAGRPLVHYGQLPTGACVPLDLPSAALTV